VRKIYGNHKQALDIIFEHKPNLQREIRDYIIRLLDKHPELKQVGSTPQIVRFIHKEWSFNEEWRRKSGAFSDAGLTSEVEILKNLKNLKLELVIGNLPNKGNKEQLRKMVATRLGFEHSTQRDYPRAWIAVALDISDIDGTDTIFLKIDEWWDYFLNTDQRRICAVVNEALDEIGVRSNP